MGTRRHRLRLNFPSPISVLPRRPALVISPDPFNEQGQDVVLVAITSQEPDDHAVTIDEHDCIDGVLPKRSFVKASKLFTVHTSRKSFASQSALPSNSADELMGRL